LRLNGDYYTTLDHQARAAPERISARLSGGLDSSRRHVRLLRDKTARDSLARTQVLDVDFDDALGA